MHTILRAIVDAMKNLDERTRADLHRQISDHEAASAPAAPAASEGPDTAAETPAADAGTAAPAPAAGA